MCIQLSLFEERDTIKWVVGSKEWMFERFIELNQLTFEDLEKYENEIYDRYELKHRWFNDYDYYSSIVIIDIFHSTKLNQFKKKYPKALVYFKCPSYINDVDINNFI